jgi:hypothetical protein
MKTMRKRKTLMLFVPLSVLTFNMKLKGEPAHRMEQKNQKEKKLGALITKINNIKDVPRRMLKSVE